MADPILLVNIGQLLTLRGPKGPRRGHDLRELGIIQDGAVFCAGGRIVSVGTMREALRDPWIKRNRKKIEEIDCAGKVVLPGFVDSHTHLIFAGPRLVDFEKRIAGATYDEIAQAGGGIRSSIAGVRTASLKELTAKALTALNEMSAAGTATVEAKSGYGLSIAAEMKSLEAIREAARQWPGTVVATLLGAHVVPPEFQTKPDNYVKEVAEKMIPLAAKKKLAQFVDVFCDRGAFSIEDSARILEAAERHGLGVRAHLCQLISSEVWPLLRFKPASLDHMDWVGDAEIPQLAKQETVVTLLPGANHFLGLKRYPDARRLIEAGVPIALATDYNPGTSPTTSMPFVLSLACTQMRMTPAEAIAAGTINGAHALRLEERKGSVEPGKEADLGIFAAKDYREIPYWVAGNRCWATVLNGQITNPRGRSLST